MNEEGKKSATEIIEEVCDKICNDFCRYADTTDEEFECAWTRSGRMCPLHSLF